MEKRLKDRADDGFIAHTAGRYAKKQFAKGRMPIVERLVNA
jgi:small subunit ribosomal protein S5e